VRILGDHCNVGKSAQVAATAAGFADRGWN
jgi:hypothetical protein